MSKHLILSTIFVTSVVVMSFFAPETTFAAQMNFTVIPNEVPGDKATIVEVRIDPEGKRTNAIEGVLLFQKSEGVEISSIVTETGGSIFSLWPREPRYSNEDDSVRFTGGTQQGFSESSLLFRMRIFTVKPGIVTLSLIGGSTYLDDGKGTPDNLFSRSLTISLTQSVPNPINPSSADSQPPIFDTVEIGQDTETFEGKVFLSFHALDNMSGIDHYEVSESGIITNVTNNVYLLRDQTHSTRIVITAFDKAGNSTSIQVPTKYAWVVYPAVIFILLILCSLVFLFRMKLYTVKTIFS